MRYATYRDTTGHWRWCLTDKSGRIIATSPESYSSKRACERAIRAVRESAGVGVSKAASISAKRRSSSAISQPKQSLTAFLCHSSGDKPTAQELYTRLRADGIEPWLDVENLLPGQDWESEIRKAVKRSDTIIICLSEASINKRGFVQKEIKFALDVADELPEGAIFLIPLKLEECEVPERLRSKHWVEYFRPGGYERLITALRTRAQELRRKVPIKADNKIKARTTTKGSNSGYVELNVLTVAEYIKGSEFLESAAKTLVYTSSHSEQSERVDSVIKLITLSQEFDINSVEKLDAVISSSKSWINELFNELNRNKMAGEWFMSKSFIVELILLAVHCDKVNQRFLEQRGWHERFAGNVISAIKKVRNSIRGE